MPLLGNEMTTPRVDATGRFSSCKWKVDLVTTQEQKLHSLRDEAKSYDVAA
jgi:hypothetical protein